MALTQGWLAVDPRGGRRANRATRGAVHRPPSSLLHSPQLGATMAQVDFSYLQDQLQADALVRDQVRDAVRDLEHAQRASLAVLSRVHSHSQQHRASYCPCPPLPTLTPDCPPTRSLRPPRLPRPDPPPSPHRPRQPRPLDPARPVLPLQRLVHPLNPAGRLHRRPAPLPRGARRPLKGPGRAPTRQCVSRARRLVPDSTGTSLTQSSNTRHAQSTTRGRTTSSSRPKSTSTASSRSSTNSSAPLSLSLPLLPPCEDKSH